MIDQERRDAVTSFHRHQRLTVQLALASVFVGILAGFGMLLWVLTEGIEVLYLTGILLAITVVLMILEYIAALRPQFSQLRESF
jgi:hypothetical protein